MEKVAVIMSVYCNDSVGYLRMAVESILQQTYKDVALYIGVDGPVGDEMSAFLKDVDAIDSVRVSWYSENRGLACVLNDLLTLCFNDGFEYIARMDADDIAVPDRIEKQLAYMQHCPGVDVVGGCIAEIDGESKLTGKTVSYPLTHEGCRRFFRYRDPLAHPAAFFRKRYFEKAKGYRNEYRKNQDTMLWFDGFMNGCVFANLPDVVLHFRVTDDFYKSRRNGWARAKKMLADRLKMNRALNYDQSANLFALAMFCMTVSPAWVKKLLYKIR